MPLVCLSRFSRDVKSSGAEAAGMRDVVAAGEAVPARHGPVARPTTRVTPRAVPTTPIAKRLNFSIASVGRPARAPIQLHLQERDPARDVGKKPTAGHGDAVEVGGVVMASRLERCTIAEKSPAYMDSPRFVSGARWWHVRCACQDRADHSERDRGRIHHART